MGKAKAEQQLPRRRTSHGEGGGDSSSASCSIGFGFLCCDCERFCTMVGLSRIFSRSRDFFSFKCVFVSLLSLSLLVSALFCLLPLPARKLNAFDANDSVKLSAIVQASFRLQKPVSLLIPQIERLEYDIYGEIGVPDSKVAVLSMHQSSMPNWTDVVFGVLSNPINVPINPASLSFLRLSLIELFLQQYNLTLTNTTFGHPSTFEILKFQGGITIIPLQYSSIWQTPQILFNFTINNSISEILGNVTELKDQLKFGLHLRQYETVFVQITNANGSTTSPPVIVQASVISDQGALLPQRLKQLAETLADPSENLGLDNSVFGKVKGVVLSSYLNGKLFAAPPSPSPVPSPELSDCGVPSSSPYPFSSSLSPIPSRDYNRQPATSPKNSPCHSVTIVDSPPPSALTAHPPQPCLYHSPPISPSSAPTQSYNASYLRPVKGPSMPPHDISPLSALSHGSSPEKGSESPLISPSQSAPIPSSFAVGYFYRREIWFSGFCGFLILHLLFWPS